MQKMNYKYLGFFPIPLLIAVIAALYFTVPPSVYYDPGWLIPITNTLFVSLICFAVAYIALRNYKATGQIQILLLGCGVLIFGVGGAIAAYMRGLPDGANLNVTIYNTGALAGGWFHFIAAMILLSGASPEMESRRRGTWLSAGYLGVILFMALLTMASLRGIVPIFFIQGAGPTLLRQWVLGTADVLFFFSFLIFIGMYLRGKEIFLYWYALALVLTSISLTAFFIQSSVGSPVGWVGRFSQYLGGVYFIIALRTATRSARERKTSFDNVLTFSLGAAGGNVKGLTESAPSTSDLFDKELKHLYLEASTDAFYVKDLQGRYLLFNKEAARVTGKKSEEVIGKDDHFLFPAEQAKAVMDGDRNVMASGQVATYEEIVTTVKGTATYSSTKGPLFDGQGTVVGLFGFARDITERKQAEKLIAHSLKEKTVMLQEIHHRVKNNLAVIGSLLNLQANGITDESVRAKICESRDRVLSMAMIHEKLYQSADMAHIDFKEYLQSLVDNIAETYKRDGVIASVEMEPVFLDVNVGIPCGLIVNELVSNSLKYAFPDGRKGTVKVGIIKSNGSRVLFVSDNGIGLSAGIDFRKTSSLGLQLVNGLVGQIRGKIELSAGEGTGFSITLPDEAKN